MSTAGRVVVGAVVVGVVIAVASGVVAEFTARAEGDAPIGWFVFGVPVIAGVAAGLGWASRRRSAAVAAPACTLQAVGSIAVFVAVEPLVALAGRLEVWDDVGVAIVFGLLLTPGAVVAAWVVLGVARFATRVRADV